MRPTIYLEPYLSGQKRPVWMSPSFPETETILQLATDHVMVRIPKTKKTGTEIENYNTADVIEKYGVTPKEFIDVKALQGDTSDNIPGVTPVSAKRQQAHL